MITLIKEYWPIGLVVMWFTYSWWNSRQVMAKIPQLRQQNALFIDVRSPQEFASSHAPGTVNIPLTQLSQKMDEVPLETPIVLCCASGTRSAVAKRKITLMGFKKVYNIGSWTNFLKLKS